MTTIENIHVPGGFPEASKHVDLTTILHSDELNALRLKSVRVSEQREDFLTDMPTGTDLPPPSSDSSNGFIVSLTPPGSKVGKIISTTDSTDPRLRQYLCGDVALYTIEDGKVFLYIGRRDVNPILSNLAEYITPLARGHVPASSKDVERIRGAKETLRVCLDEIEPFLSETNLSIGRDSGRQIQYAQISISTSNPYEWMNPSCVNLVHRMFGETNFDDVTSMLNGSGIQETKIFMIHPSWVRFCSKQDIVDSMQGEGLMYSTRLQDAMTDGYVNIANHDTTYKILHVCGKPLN